MITGRPLIIARSKGDTSLSRMILPPVGLMDLPRGVGDFPDQQEQVFPHLPGQPLAGGSRELRQGVGEVLVDDPAAEPNHVVEQPCQPRAAARPLSIRIACTMQIKMRTMT